jgi:hypothetical protein
MGQKEQEGSLPKKWHQGILSAFLVLKDPLVPFLFINGAETKVGGVLKSSRHL